jgi:hypothetical protein
MLGAASKVPLHPPDWDRLLCPSITLNSRCRRGLTSDSYGPSHAYFERRCARSRRSISSLGNWLPGPQILCRESYTLSRSRLLSHRKTTVLRSTRCKQESVGLALYAQKLLRKPPGFLGSEKCSARLGVRSQRAKSAKARSFGSGLRLEICTFGCLQF